ncbi:phosphonoacetaldehyde reductase [Aristaeella hokkaidonensis]|uniref:Phosphonoacetaldehyde reductase n=1 Tax=Aristaeella hokkaidonensis TaxID=3046382 RepID=A0AC61N9F5_9FIRM|nr:phosphonoacetaldehyde reductase [Aristaeella hokkaidonensis]QUC67893.1 phosphonoacetaldehyde reductase [Aristaeella hokkaidonensis]SNT92960.1 Alcohol dehydrogenase, class IV [Aristaeella hokkaidonensis]
MNDYQKVIRGRESLKRLPELCEKLGIQRPLIVGMEPLTGTLLKKNPWLLSAPVYTGFHSNPDLKDSQEGAGLYVKEHCDGLISVGGGSSIDTAKAIKARLNAKTEDDVISGRLEGTVSCPHIAVPGTAGTGSEATQIAVAYVNGNKVSLNHPSLRPDGVILDASLLDSLPLYHKKSCALDALSQGIESYWSRGANDDSKVNAFLSIIGVLDNLKAYLEGDPHAAEEMLDASYQSGKAIQITRTTAAHAMSYMLTKKMGLAHGHACFLTLPVLWESMQEKEEMQEILKDLSTKMRLGDIRMGPKLLKGILYDLEMQIPPVPDEAVLEELACSVNTERLSNHPVKMTKEEIKQIYRRAMIPLRDNEKQACLDIWRYYGRE